MENGDGPLRFAAAMVVASAPDGGARGRVVFGVGAGGV